MTNILFNFDGLIYENNINWQTLDNFLSSIIKHALNINTYCLIFTSFSDEMLNLYKNHIGDDFDELTNRKLIEFIKFDDEFSPKQIDVFFQNKNITIFNTIIISNYLKLFELLNSLNYYTICCYTNFEKNFDKKKFLLVSKYNKSIFVDNFLDELEPILYAFDLYIEEFK